MPLDGLELVIAMLAVVTGACLQGSLGFGLGLVAAPILVMLDPSLVPAVVLGIGTPLTYLVAWREREAIELTRLSWAMGGRILGNVGGSFAVLVLNERGLAAAFALAVLLGVGLSLAGLNVSSTRTNFFAAGTLSGVMGTATSVGGPPMALLLQREEGPALRASLAAFMAFGSTTSLIALILVGEFDGDAAVTTGVLVVPVLIGFLLSRWTNPILDRGYTRPAVLLFAALSALSILARQVL